MGTIRIEQYSSLGSDANRDAPVADLRSILVTTVDSTTSTSAESVVLNKDCKAVVVYGAEAHRVSVGTDTTGSVYGFVAAETSRDFGVPQGATLYYRADA